jgi:hypothetical protein
VENIRRIQPERQAEKIQKSLLLMHGLMQCDEIKNDKRQNQSDMQELPEKNTQQGAGMVMPLVAEEIYTYDYNEENRDEEDGK